MLMLYCVLLLLIQLYERTILMDLFLSNNRNCYEFTNESIFFPPLIKLILFFIEDKIWLLIWIWCSKTNLIDICSKFKNIQCKFYAKFFDVVSFLNNDHYTVVEFASFSFYRFDNPNYQSIANNDNDNGNQNFKIKYKRWMTNTGMAI